MLCKAIGRRLRSWQHTSLVEYDGEVVNCFHEHPRSHQQRFDQMTQRQEALDRKVQVTARANKRIARK